MRMRPVPSLALLLALSVPRPAAAQAFEVGGSLGVGARGSESELARQEALPVAGVHGSVLLGDRFETMVRVAWLDLNDPGGTTYYADCRPEFPRSCDPSVAVGVRSRLTAPRTFINGNALYHFRRGKPVRPFAGAGFGVMRDQEQVTCELAGCDAYLPGFRASTRTLSYADLIGVFGASVAVADRVVIRGAVHFHRPAGEELSLFETTAMVGYRF